MDGIGIDLGTTNSLIAIVSNGKPQLVPNSLGQFLTPSVVSVDSEGCVLTGIAAKDRLISHPGETVASFKRLMGTRQKTKLGKREFSPEELSALVLGSLKSDAETFLQKTISDVVISVPAYFNDQQRKATVDAGLIAGLRVERLINEPTAAALSYGLADKQEGKYLVFDLGGGTFDVSILDKYEDVFEIRATTGDTRLGGDDFNSVLEQIILSKLSLKIADLPQSERAVIRRQSELAKHALTSNQETEITLSFVPNGSGSARVSRSEFGNSCAELLNRLRLPTERAVRDARIAPKDFEAIVLVGGATRMQMVRSLVARMFGRLPLVSVDPDTAIALGAAVQSALIRRSEGLRDIVMTDVSPYTLGVASVEDEDSDRLTVTPIIERNAVIPISRSAQFFSVKNNQTRLAIQVYQGENLRPENNVHLGTIEVAIPRSKKGQEGVDVRFTYDINGILQVEVTVLSTKKVQSKIFQNNAGLSDVEIKARIAALSHLKIAPRDQAENKAVLARAERLYEENRGNSRDDLRQVIAAFERDISDQRTRNHDASRKHYQDILDSFEHLPIGKD